MKNQRIVQDTYPVTVINEVEKDIVVLRFAAPPIAQSVKPGQFINIRVHNHTDPLLRRPFSVRRILGEEVEIIFDIAGRGTSILAGKKIGESVDVIGPLGIPFTLDDPGDEAILVGGGMGVAPLPILTDALSKSNTELQTFVGARTSKKLVLQDLRNIHVATDDGSRDFCGTAVELLADYLKSGKQTRRKIFACGPNPMLKSLSNLLQSYDIPCEVSLESVMACGFGICQGCPVEITTGEKKYGLVCTDGPVFNIRTIKFT